SGLSSWRMPSPLMSICATAAERSAIGVAPPSRRSRARSGHRCLGRLSKADSGSIAGEADRLVLEACLRQEHGQLLADAVPRKAVRLLQVLGLPLSPTKRGGDCRHTIEDIIGARGAVGHCSPRA